MKDRRAELIDELRAAVIGLLDHALDHNDGDPELMHRIDRALRALVLHDERQRAATFSPN